MTNQELLKLLFDRNLIYVSTVGDKLFVRDVGCGCCSDNIVTDLPPELLDMLRELVQ